MSHCDTGRKPVRWTGIDRGTAAMSPIQSPSLDAELFLPEPAPREVRYTVISVDDHVVEPPHLFDTYLPESMRARGPQIVEAANGAQVWSFDDQIFSQVGMNAGARVATTCGPASRTWTSAASGRCSTSRR